jgi:glycosyltransferase involved in cell wall biosynthesis
MDNQHDHRTAIPGDSSGVRRPCICVVTRTWQSGAGRFAADLCHSLARAGADVFFIAPAMAPASIDPPHPAVVRITLPRETHGGAMWKRVSSRLGRALHATHALLKLSLTVRPSHGCIFTVPDPWPVTVPVFLALKLLRVPVAVVVHDPIPHDYSGGARTIAKSVDRRLTGLAYRLADRLVLLSEGGRQKMLEEHASCRDKIAVIPLGAITLDRSSPMPMTRTLLCFGSVRPNKSVVQVIQSVVRLRRGGCDVRLLVVGGANPAHFYAAACIEAAAQDPDGITLDFTYFDDDRLPELMGRVDAFVLAYDNFHSQSGVAVLAGLAARPVIASAGGGLKDLRGMGLVGTEIAAPVTVDSITAAIGDFLARPAVAWREDAERGADSLRQHLDWDHLAARYLAVCGPREKPAPARPARAMNGNAHQ